MAHLYGWIHIEDLEIDSREVDKLIEELPQDGLFINRTVMNAVSMIHFSSCHNHFGELERRVIEFYHAISKMVDSESYGLLYIYDDEGRNGHHDQFQVLRLAKNEVSEQNDPFFSPYSEKIADFSDD